MNIDDIAKQSLLYEFYGQLLTGRQQQIMEMYTQENFSLAEISYELGISRQAVHDALRTGRKALEGYEDKLGLVGRHLKMMDAIDEIDRKILEIIKKTKDPGVIDRLEKIKSVIDGLEDQ